MAAGWQRWKWRPYANGSRLGDSSLGLRGHPPGRGYAFYIDQAGELSRGRGAGDPAARAVLSPAPARRVAQSRDAQTAAVRCRAFLRLLNAAAPIREIRLRLVFAGDVTPYLRDNAPSISLDEFYFPTRPGSHSPNLWRAGVKEFSFTWPDEAGYHPVDRQGRCDTADGERAQERRQPPGAGAINW